MRIILPLLLACAASLVQAQATEPHLVGYLSSTSLANPADRARHEAFTDRLRELGSVNGRSIVVETRFAEGRFDRLGLLAAQLVGGQAEVIVVNGAAATSAARRATATIPIVAASIANPVASGFAQSLERPGGNVTGFATMGSLVYEKRLALLAEAAPDAKRIGLLIHPEKEFFLQILPGLEAAARRLGRELVLANVQNAKAIRDGFDLLKTRSAGAVLVGEGRLLDSHGAAVATLALQNKLPSIFPEARGAEEGGLLGCANDEQQRYRSAAEYVHRILKGELPGELPIVQPEKIELVVNLRTAAALGIAIPPSIRGRADRTIE